MKKLMSHQLFKLFAISMSSVSMLLSSNQAFAFEFQPEDDQGCCAPSCCAPTCFSGCGAFLAGVVVAGGVAILAVDHCRDGSTGSTGPTGSGLSFSHDEEETLAFEFSALDITFDFGAPANTDVNVNVADPAPFNVKVTPIVVTPNGEVFRGDTTIIETTGTSTHVIHATDLGVIIVTDPVYGGYGPGVEIEVPSASDLPVIYDDIEILLRVDVESSRDESETTVYGSEYNYQHTQPSEFYQIIADFAYGRELSVSLD